MISDRVTHVWVDLDDTLIDFEANSRAALKWLYETEAIDRWYATADEWIEAYEAHNKQLWALYAVGGVTREQLRADRFSLPLTDAGADKATALDCSSRFDTEYLDALAGQRCVIDGAHRLLRELRRRGYFIGVLSNGFKEVQFRKMKSAGLDTLVDLIVLSDDIGVNKPDVRLYRYAESRSGCINPECHLMVGDNLSTDIAGSLAAGWSAVLFDRHGLHTEQGAGVPVVHTLNQILAKKMP